VIGARSARVILLPGVGSDGRMFEPQRRGSRPGNAGLAAPQDRGIAAVAGGTHGPGRFAAAYAFLGGASFGGPVALEMSRHLRNCRAVRMIAGATKPPARYRMLGPLARLMPVETGVALLPIYECIAFRGVSGPDRSLIRRMAGDADPSFVRWACRALSRWSSDGPSPVRMHRIHGGRDWILPAGPGPVDRVVPGAEHLLTCTHANQVNAWLAEKTAK
jgi:hypothetical protein